MLVRSVREALAGNRPLGSLDLIEPDGTEHIHGGQETTILTALVPLIHLGMVFVGTPYGQNQQLLVTDGIGGSPYGPGTLAGTDGSRQPVEAELSTARNLGSRLARVAGRLKDLRVSRASAP